MTDAAAGAARDDRRRFLRCRRRVFAAAGVTATALGVLAALLIAPNRLASLRVHEVALAWWVAGLVALTALVALGRGFREAGGDRTAGVSRGTPLALAVVWSSPALCLGVPPLLLADGTWGLWPPVVVFGGAVVALLLHGTPWTRTGGLMATASALARARWPGARASHRVLGSIETIIVLVFVWAQLAAVRQIGELGDWPRATTVGVTLLTLGTLLFPDLARIRLTALGGGLALAGLAVPLALLALGTTPAWSFVWNAVASRPQIAFGEGTAWTAAGGPVRGSARPPALRFADAQRVEFTGRGSIIVEPREGGRYAREVEAGEDIALHPGDQLVVAGDPRLRFEAGRRIPDAPDSGPDWAEPRWRPVGWPWLIGLGLTGFLGALGVPMGRISAGTGRLSPERSAGLTALVVMAGTVLPAGWALYAAWLTPEVYAGGVTGVEVYALAASMPGAHASGPLLTWLAAGGLAIGSVAAALSCVRGLPSVSHSGTPSARRLALAVVATAGSLACVLPVDAWTLLVLTLGLAASSLAPAGILGCWSMRLTPESVAGGAVAGLVVFLLVAVTGVTGQEGPATWGAAAAAPAMAAAPVHFLVAWVLRGIPSPRLSAPLPARPRTG